MICERCVNFKGDARYYEKYHLWLCNECKRWLDEIYELVNETKKWKDCNTLYARRGVR